MARVGNEVGVGGRSTFSRVYPQYLHSRLCHFAMKTACPPLHSTVHAYIFVRSRSHDNFNPIFACSFFLSFFLFSPMLYLNTENYILPDPAQNVKRNSFCNREREFIFIKFSVEIFSLSNIRSSNRSRDCSSTTFILYHEMYFFSSPGHLHPFPPCTVCFYFLARSSH